MDPDSVVTVNGVMCEWSRGIVGCSANNAATGGGEEEEEEEAVEERQNNGLLAVFDARYSSTHLPTHAYTQAQTRTHSNHTCMPIYSAAECSAYPLALPPWREWRAVSRTTVQYWSRSHRSQQGGRSAVRIGGPPCPGATYQDDKQTHTINTSAQLQGVVK